MLRSCYSCYSSPIATATAAIALLQLSYYCYYSYCYSPPLTSPVATLLLQPATSLLVLLQPFLLKQLLLQLLLQLTAIAATAHPISPIYSLSYYY